MDLVLNVWTSGDYADFIEYLKSNACEKYRDFQSHLIPDSKEIMLGIKIPELRKIGREIAKGGAESFLKISSPGLYETRMIRGIVTGLIKTCDFEKFTQLCDAFICEINSWAICDTFCCGLKELKKYKDEYFEYIQKYLQSDNVWAVRAALVIMLDYYLDDNYIDAVLKRVDAIDSEFYYVRMAQAWLIATAFVKCENKTRAYLLDNSLNDPTFNKAIQKCVESRRIDENTKNYLKTLKRH
ncbi:MAG: DNA alkylation repair protein [Clostridiales bacterium]|nr:DNA alkylation repair protein [Clostridiales bacterium]